MYRCERCDKRTHHARPSAIFKKVLCVWCWMVMDNNQQEALASKK